MRILWLGVASGFFLLLAPEASAQDFDYALIGGLMRDIREGFSDASMVMSQRLYLYSRRLFLSLMTLEFIFWAIKMYMLRVPKADGRVLLYNLITKIMALGLLLLVITAWPSSVLSQLTGYGVIESFQTLGERVSGVRGLDVTNLFAKGLLMIMSLASAFAKLGGVFGKLFFGGVLLQVPIIVTLLAMIVATAMVVYTFVRSYIALAIGPFMLAWGGSRWTAALAEGYVRFLFATGIRIFLVYAIVGVGLDLFEIWGEGLTIAVGNFDFDEVFSQLISITLGSVAYAAVLVFLPRALADQVVSFQFTLGIKDGITAEAS